MEKELNIIHTEEENTISFSSKNLESSHQSSDKYHLSETDRQILEQISFYFSDKNLLFDPFMRNLCGASKSICSENYQKYNENEYSSHNKSTDSNSSVDPEFNNVNCDNLNLLSISNDASNLSTSEQKENGTTPVLLEYFLKFPRIVKLVHSLDELVTTISNDKDQKILKENNLEFDPKNLTIRRLMPFQSDSNQTRIVIFEGFLFQNKTKKIDHLLKECFKYFGSINFINVKHSEKDKFGFAFIEFVNKESAKQCVDVMKIIVNELKANAITSGDDSFKKESEIEKIKELLFDIRHNEYEFQIFSKYEWNSYRNRYLRKMRKFSDLLRKRNEIIKERFNLDQSKLYLKHSLKFC